MKPIPVLGIPHYNRADLLARCIASIDYPVRKLVIVQQGPEQSGARIPGNPLATETIFIRHPNAGVAGAWNEIIKLFPAPWWMLVNDDIAFTPGDLRKMAECVDREIADLAQMPALVYGHAASWFAITPFGVSRAGLFDENIYPAYLEDCDWHYRALLAGVRLIQVPDVHAIHGCEPQGQTGSCTILSDPVLREKNHRTHGGNFDYYRAKWGGINGREKFKTPFNDPLWPVWAWRFDPEFRAKQQW